MGPDFYRSVLVNKYLASVARPLMHQQELMKDDDICIFLLVHIYYLLMYQYRSRDLLLEVANITGKNLQYIGSIRPFRELGDKYCTARNVLADFAICD